MSCCCVDLFTVRGYYYLMDTRRRAADAYRNASTKNRTPEKSPADTKLKGFLKEAGGDAGGKAGTKSLTGRTGTQGYRKAAKFLLLLGKKESAKVLSNFSEDEIRIITKEIASIKKIDKDESQRILEEFGYLKPKKPYTAGGGIEAAREMLYNAFGEKRGQEVLDRVLPFGGEKPFAFLEDLENEQLIMVLRKESVSVLAVVCMYLDPVKASVVLETLHPEMQKELVTRMAGIRRVAPEALRAIEATLIERIRTQGKVVTEEIDGQNVLASILKNMNLEDEDRILTGLEQENRELSSSIRKKLFTMDTVLGMRDKDLQKVLRDYSDKEIAVLLKGRKTAFRDKMLASVSERRREFIRLEGEALGAMLRSEVDTAMQDFLNYLRECEIQGSILFDREKDQYI